MENKSQEIISSITADKREKWRAQWNSVIMEKEAFIQTVDKFLAEVSTDAHIQISALMSNFAS